MYALQRRCVKMKMFLHLGFSLLLVAVSVYLGLISCCFVCLFVVFNSLLGFNDLTSAALGHTRMIYLFIHFVLLIIWSYIFSSSSCSYNFSG